MSLPEESECIYHLLGFIHTHGLLVLIYHLLIVIIVSEFYSYLFLGRLVSQDDKVQGHLCFLGNINIRKEDILKLLGTLEPGGFNLKSTMHM